MFVRVRRTREHRHRKTEMGVRAARDSFILMHLLRSFFSPLPFRPRTYAHTFFRRDANTFTRRFKKGYKLSCVVSSETTDKKSSPPKDVSSNEPPKSDFQSHVSLGFFVFVFSGFSSPPSFFIQKEEIRSKTHRRRQSRRRLRRTGGSAVRRGILERTGTKKKKKKKKKKK
jgi:hypothetical protein